MTQAVLPIFKKRDEGGRGDIINIGSIAGRDPYPGGSIYCASKAAVRAFTDALRRELIATRIRVIEIDPGQVETEFSVVRFGGDKAKADAVYKDCEPLTPEDIAEVVIFTAGRRENVVIADTLIFPSHQVCPTPGILLLGYFLTFPNRQLRRSCTRRRDANLFIQNFVISNVLVHISRKEFFGHDSPPNFCSISSRSSASAISITLPVSAVFLINSLAPAYNIRSSALQVTGRWYNKT